VSHDDETFVADETSTNIVIRTGTYDQSISNLGFTGTGNTNQDFLDFCQGLSTP
jgi:hypothetical protein